VDIAFFIEPGGWRNPEISITFLIEIHQCGSHLVASWSQAPTVEKAQNLREGILRFSSKLVVDGIWNYWSLS